MDRSNKSYSFENLNERSGQFCTAVTNRVKVAILHRGDNTIEVGFRVWGRARKRNFAAERKRACTTSVRRLRSERRPRACVRGRNVVRLPRFGLPLF